LSSLNLSDIASRELKCKIEAYSLANRFVASGTPVEQAEVAAVVGTIQAGPSAAPPAPDGNTAKRAKATRGAGKYDREPDRKALTKEKAPPRKLAMLLAMMNHPDNPSDSSEINESWRSWTRNASLVKKCHDVCLGGDGEAFIAKYAPVGKLVFGTWKCKCNEE
jgi:hypothetical protein